MGLEVLLFHVCHLFLAGLGRFPREVAASLSGATTGRAHGGGQPLLFPGMFGSSKASDLLVAAHKSVDDTDVHIWLYCKGNGGFVCKGLNSWRHLSEPWDCQ